MKKLILIFVVLFVSNMLNSCKEDQFSSESIQITEEVLANDLDFKRLQNLIDSRTQKIMDDFGNLDFDERKEFVNKLKTFSESDITSEDMGEISKLLGFGSVDEMNKFHMDFQYNMNLLLEHNPSLKNMDNEEKTQLFTNTINQIVVERNNEMLNKSRMSDCNLKALGACISGAYGGLLVAFSVCTSLIIPQAVGLCYGGSSIVYIAALVTCDD